ncbi:MAG TPA: TlpA disulfide reductase family protein [Solirubrobacterales bacterium]
MNARAFAAALAVLAVVGLLGFGLVSKGGAEIAEGDPAPEATLPKLDGSGSQSLADYRGKWVLVNFWASWCNPCRTESPDLQRYQEQHGSNAFTVLGINQEDLTHDAEAFIDEFDLTYPQLRDASGDLADPFGMSGLPESFLIDPQGDIALIRRGALDDTYLDDFVTPLITAATAEESSDS